MTPPAVMELSDARPMPARFALGTAGALAQGGVHLASVYLETTPAGVAAPANLDLLQSIAGVIKVLIGPWVIGGDWNDTPCGPGCDWLP